MRGQLKESRLGVRAGHAAQRPDLAIADVTRRERSTHGWQLLEASCHSDVLVSSAQRDAAAEREQLGGRPAAPLEVHLPTIELGHQLEPSAGGRSDVGGQDAHGVLQFAVRQVTRRPVIQGKIVRTVFNRTVFNRTVFNRTVFNRTVFNRTVFNRTVFVRAGRHRMGCRGNRAVRHALAWHRTSLERPWFDVPVGRTRERRQRIVASRYLLGRERSIGHGSTVRSGCDAPEYGWRALAKAPGSSDTWQMAVAPGTRR